MAGFPRTSDPKEQADCSAFRSHTVSASLRSTGYTRLALIQCGRTTTIGIKIRKQGLLGAILEADHHGIPSKNMQQEKEKEGGKGKERGRMGQKEIF